MKFDMSQSHFMRNIYLFLWCCFLAAIMNFTMRLQFENLILYSIYSNIFLGGYKLLIIVNFGRFSEGYGGE